MDDAEAYEKYYREEEPNAIEQKAQDNPGGGRSTSTSAVPISNEDDELEWTSYKNLKLVCQGHLFKSNSSL